MWLPGILHSVGHLYIVKRFFVVLPTVDVPSAGLCMVALLYPRHVSQLTLVCTCVCACAYNV